MSEYEHGNYNNSQFYGHTFRLSEEHVDDEEIGLPLLKPRNSRHRKQIGRFKKTQREKRRNLRKKIKQETLDSFHDQWRIDHSTQIKWFEHYKISPKNTPNKGIKDSITYYHKSDMEFSVGQYHFYTHYLLHGNRANGPDGFIYPTDALSGGMVNYLYSPRLEASVIAGYPTKFPILNTDPMGDNSRIHRLRVRTYDSAGDYIESSFEEVSPTIRNRFKHTMMTFHPSNL